MITTVVFDVGETLIDESRIWLRWAERLGATPSTLLGVYGACLSRGQSFSDALRLVSPGLDVEAEEARWAVDEPESLRSGFDAADLYSDVLPALAALREAGLRLVICGNQPPAATPALEAMSLPVDLIRNSAEMGVEKPDPVFFEAVAQMVEAAPSQIAYVGDRLDNDALPAREAGMTPIFIRRGPLGHLQAAEAAARGIPIIDSLMEIRDLIDDVDLLS